MEVTISNLLMLQKYQFKTKYSQIKDYALCLVNISKTFIINNMKKQD